MWIICERYETPLYVAVGCGNKEIAEILCDRGANTNLGNIDNETPLSLAHR